MLVFVLPTHSVYRQFYLRSQIVIKKLDAHGLWQGENSPVRTLSHPKTGLASADMVPVQC